LGVVVDDDKGRPTHMNCGKGEMVVVEGQEIMETGAAL
jgi:hypothetical protein